MQANKKVKYIKFYMLLALIGIPAIMYSAYSVQQSQAQQVLAERAKRIQECNNTYQTSLQTVESRPFMPGAPQELDSLLAVQQQCINQ